MIKRIYSKLNQYLARRQKRKLVKRYLKNGQKPWTAGYELYKWKQIKTSLACESIMTAFQNTIDLPDAYGFRIDERIIEYPWLFSRLSNKKSHTLDAGSALNFGPIIEKLHSLQRELTIYTLAPEDKAFWKQKVSYQYGDLRALPFQNNWFNEVISLSTLEHIGASNHLYTTDTADAHEDNQQDFTAAAQEMWRVLKPGGDLFITVPYGSYQEIFVDRQLFMRQFDNVLLQQLLKCFPDACVNLFFYQYHPHGWQRSTQNACNQLQYFNIHTAADYDNDYAAAARAVCCIHAQKPV